MNKVLCMTLLICTHMQIHSSAAESGSLKLHAQQSKEKHAKAASIKKIVATAVFTRTDGNWEVEDRDGETEIKIFLLNGVTLGKRITKRSVRFWGKEPNILANMDKAKYADKIPLFALIENHSAEKDTRSCWCIPYQSTHSVERRYNILSDNTVELTADSAEKK